MKSCKGCKHLSESVFGPDCTHDAVLERRINRLTERVSWVYVGTVKAAHMRAPNGRCGPDRKLYETFWSASWNALKQIWKSLTTRGS